MTGAQVSERWGFHKRVAQASNPNTVKLISTWKQKDSKYTFLQCVFCAA